MDFMGAWGRCVKGLVLVSVSTTFLCSGTALGAPPLTRALTDDVWFSGTPAANAQWTARTPATGAKIVLLEIDWVSLEPSAPPAGVDPTNPAGPQFDFSYVDARVKAFAGSGISVALLVTDAPAWAQGPGGTAAERSQGAWEPSPTAFGQLATALARRYSGSYRDPANPGHTLPRVRYFQAWAEANFTVHLAPQWVSQGGHEVPFAPNWYRMMLNAFYTGIKSAHSDNVVIATGLGPYGDPSPGGCTGPNAPDVGNGCRIPPAAFARDLMCLQGEALRPASCPNPAHFDALAIDPYDVGSPTTSATNIDDVSTPDLGKLTRVLSKAVPSGRALPRVHKQLWVTEFGYQSNPPQPGGASLPTQARWLEQALYLFWKQGVSTAVWYLIRDVQYSPDALGYTGLYLFNGTPKPSLTAYEFPLVVASSGNSATVWGISPQRGKLTVQRQHGRSWKTLFRVQASPGGVFVHNIPSSLHGNFRALIGGQSSLVWTY
jgi:hypothetical protein